MGDPWERGRRGLGVFPHKFNQHPGGQVYESIATLLSTFI